MHQNVSWIHFGDLHISNKEDQNYQDFLQLIEEVNRFMCHGIAFGLLPGDNADNGESDQYALVAEALSLSRLPIHAIPGDHDIATGNLNLFQDCFQDDLPRSFMLGNTHFILLNSVANWKPPVFGLGQEQMTWLRQDLASVPGNGSSIVVFMHAYPSEHADESAELADLFKRNHVNLVEMGHTHYNELANDGQIVYAATRSTGQREEGPVGYSVTTIDEGVISWQFKPMGEWPLVVITCPGDHRLIVDASSPIQLVRGAVQVRVRVWGGEVATVMMEVDGKGYRSLKAIDDFTWGCEWDSTQLADGLHVLAATAATSVGRGTDSITVVVNQRSKYTPPPRYPVDYENTLGAWHEKHILGTQLGPNENGRQWLSRYERKPPAQ